MTPNKRRVSKRAMRIASAGYAFQMHGEGHKPTPYEEVSIESALDALMHNGWPELAEDRDGRTDGVK